MYKILSLLVIMLGMQVNAKLSQHNAKSNSLLWEISGNNLPQSSYLYGTMHLVCHDEGVNKNKVQKAVRATEQLYMELDASAPGFYQDVMGAINNETKIKDIQNDVQKQKLLTLASQHLDTDTDLLKDVGMFSLFSMLTIKSIPQCKLPHAVEESLTQMFKDEGKKTNGFETFEQQFAYLLDSDILDIDVMIKTLENFEAYSQSYTEMSLAYDQENLQALYEMMNTPTAYHSEVIIENVIEELVNERNDNWLKVIPDIAAKQPTFFAVGAGHLPGKHGVIQLLRNKGYQVKAILD